MRRNPTRLDQAASHRLRELRELVRSGATEVVGRGLRSESGEVVRRGRGGVSTMFPELKRAGVTPGVAARAIARGKGKVYRRLHEAARRQLAAVYPERRRYAQAPVVAPHRRLTRKCTRCGVPHGKGEHRFHGEGAYHQTHLFAFNPRRRGSVEQQVIRELQKFGYSKREATRRAATAQGSNVGEMVKRIVLADTHAKNPTKRRRPSCGARKNPPAGAVKIYGRLLRIEAQKTQPHRCDAACRRVQHRYFHDFTSSPSIYGMADGTLVIR